MLGTSVEPRPLDQAIPVVVVLESMQVGGTAAYATELAVHIHQRGYRTLVVYPEPVAAEHGPLTGATYLNRLRVEGVPVRSVYQAAQSSFRSRLARVINFVVTFMCLRRPVVLLVMGYIDGGAPAALAARLAGARAIVRAELQPPMPPLGPREVRVARFRDWLVHRVVVGCEQNRHAVVEVMRRRPSKMRVVSTGIDSSGYLPGRNRASARREFGYDDGDVVIGVISRLVARKGVGDFITAAKAVARDHPRARFLIVGDGIERNSLESRAAALGVASVVAFTGYRGDIERVLSAMDIFAMPSHFEGGPIVLLQAMAMGLPVVATRVGMAPEVIRAGISGLLVDTSAPDELAISVSALVDDAWMRDRLGRAAEDRVKGDYTLDAMVDGYMRIFAEVAAR